MAVWQIAKLLNRYYEKVGRAAADEGSCPKFKTFKAGFGYVNESVAAGELPILLPVPANLESVPNTFFTGAVQVSYSNGTTLVRCEIPQGGVSQPCKCNFIGVYDQDNELVAVCVSLPDWVTPSEAYRAYPAITFPLEEIVTNG